jgi:hypothetical protein
MPRPYQSQFGSRMADLTARGAQAEAQAIQQQWQAVGNVAGQTIGAFNTLREQNELRQQREQQGQYYGALARQAEVQADQETREAQEDEAGLAYMNDYLLDTGRYNWTAALEETTDPQMKRWVFDQSRVAHTEAQNQLEVQWKGDDAVAKRLSGILATVTTADQWMDANLKGQEVMAEYKEATGRDISHNWPTFTDPEGKNPFNLVDIRAARDLGLATTERIAQARLDLELTKHLQQMSTESWEGWSPDDKQTVLGWQNERLIRGLQMAETAGEAEAFWEQHKSMFPTESWTEPWTYKEGLFQTYDPTDPKQKAALETYLGTLEEYTSESLWQIINRNIMGDKNATMPALGSSEHLFLITAARRAGYTAAADDAEALWQDHHERITLVQQGDAQVLDAAARGVVFRHLDGQFNRIITNLEGVSSHEWPEALANAQEAIRELDRNAAQQLNTLEPEDQDRLRLILSEQDWNAIDPETGKARRPRRAAMIPRTVNDKGVEQELYNSKHTPVVNNRGETQMRPANNLDFRQEGADEEIVRGPNLLPWKEVYAALDDLSLRREIMKAYPEWSGKDLTVLNKIDYVRTGYLLPQDWTQTQVAEEIGRLGLLDRIRSNRTSG